MAVEEEEAAAAAAERVVVGSENMSVAASHGDNLSSLNTGNNGRQNETREESQVSGNPSSSSSSSSSSLSSAPSSDKTNTTTNMNKGKSCKGCLYYSSTFKSNSRNPLCVGFARSLPNVPRNVVSKSEMEASQAGSSLSDFKYGCIGYSVYSDRKGHPVDEKETPTELPLCVGIEVLVDRRLRNAGSTPAHVHNKEDGSVISQPRPRKPAHPVNDEFLTRFKRNANLVAMGVVKNMRKVGNRVKESVDDILYPYRRRPK